ncbi:hypothetical protein PR048_021602 [Dryococelus australis]|uniref:Reverse transcriptase RNase H-like domain-containing protein n=1 Tax=Dryococelus australis TaxID=614101 RepID=A0ABQ9GYN0_9NEOP|nr:hypothetical protein PR048_021602 [Dryococelus australis]
MDGLEWPICFASKTLSGVENNYCQLQKKALSIIFAVKKFHTYLYECKFVLYTDHLPSVAILGPTKDEPYLAAAHLQRWTFLLYGYRYDVQYRKGQKMGTADALSRLPLLQSEPLEHPIYSASTIPNVPIQPAKIAQATEEDNILRDLLHGWPAEIEEKLKPYLNKKDDLAVGRGCHMWGGIIPAQLTEEVLQMLHEGHPGVASSGVTRIVSLGKGVLKMAISGVKPESSRSTVLPLRHLVRQRHTHSKIKITSRVWERMHVDFAEKDQQYMLILVDNYSKWVEVMG